MNAVDLDNRGVTDLMIAMVSLAYDDYVNGAILLNHSIYEESNGVIKLIEVRGKSIDAYRRTKKSEFNCRVKYYSSAKKFFENTRLGEYLLQKAETDIAKDKHRGVRKTVHVYEGVNR